MSNRVEPEIPTITLDHDQVKSSRGGIEKNIATKQKVASKAVEEPSSSITKSLLILIPYIAIVGGGWYFYQQQIALTSALNSSVNRIQQLENQLSATGEEMGESTIALKVKLEAISEKTELLLTEMDKLWASAWRRNQKEIKELNSKSIKLASQQGKNTSAMNTQNSSIKELSDKITATEFSIDAVSEQIVAANTVKDQISKLSSQFNALDTNAKTRDKQQMVTATSINEFDTSLQLLVERLERIEAKLASSTTTPIKP